jgi:Arc/MetJ-type ribon-helix-helix transcriptional regulator
MARAASAINLNLPSATRAYLDAQVAAGRTKSVDQYILRLIEADRRLDDEERRLREAIAEGLDENDGAVEYTAETLKDLTADISRRGREKLAKQGR